MNYKWKRSTQALEVKLPSATGNNDGVWMPQNFKPVLENQKLFWGQTEQATCFVDAWNEFTGFPRYVKNWLHKGTSLFSIMSGAEIYYKEYFGPFSCNWRGDRNVNRTIFTTKTTAACSISNVMVYKVQCRAPPRYSIIIHNLVSWVV